MEQPKGILSMIFNGEGAIVEFNPSKGFVLTEFEKTIEAIRASDGLRKEILDKEYTPIEDVKLKDIEESLSVYGDSIPKGLFVKVRWGGRYLDMPAIALRDSLREIHRYFNEHQGKNLERSVATGAE